MKKITILPDMPQQFNILTEDDLLIESPNGNKYKIIVDDNGNIGTQLITQ